MGENEESCPRSGDIDEVGYGALQDIGMYKRFTHLCVQYLKMDDDVPQWNSCNH